VLRINGTPGKYDRNWLFKKINIFYTDDFLPSGTTCSAESYTVKPGRCIEKVNMITFDFMKENQEI